MLEGYADPMKVIALRNQLNIGIVDNYAASFKKTSGDLIFIAAGDAALKRELENVVRAPKVAEEAGGAICADENTETKRSQMLILEQ